MARGRCTTEISADTQLKVSSETMKNACGKQWRIKLQQTSRKQTTSWNRSDEAQAKLKDTASQRLCGRGMGGRGRGRMCWHYPLQPTEILLPHTTSHCRGFCFKVPRRIRNLCLRKHKHTHIRTHVHVCVCKRLPIVIWRYY